MNTASMTRTRASTASNTRKSGNYRVLDVMVVAIGLTVSVAGFLSREITWVFAGA